MPNAVKLRDIHSMSASKSKELMALATNNATKVENIFLPLNELKLVAICLT